MNGRNQLTRARIVFVDLVDQAFSRVNGEDAHRLTRGHVHTGATFPVFVELPSADEVLAMQRGGYRPLFQLCLEDPEPPDGTG